MARVNPPPIQVPKEIARDSSPAVAKYFNDLNFMVFQLWTRTGGGDDIIETVETIASTASATSAKVFQLASRIDQLEQNDKEPIFHSKIAKLNQRIDELIAELLAELKLQRPNVALEETKASLLHATVKQLELLNARIEEAYETGIDEEEV